MKRLVVFLFFLHAGLSPSSAQLSCPRNMRAGDYSCYPRDFRFFGVEAYAYGPTFGASANFTFLAKPFFSFQTGIGMNGIYFGTAYYLLRRQSRNKMAPYLGVNFVYSNAFLNNAAPSDKDHPGVSLYIPIGVQYIACNGLSFSAEVAGTTIKGQHYSSGGLKMGYFFNKQ